MRWILYIAVTGCAGTQVSTAPIQALPRPPIPAPPAPLRVRVMTLAAIMALRDTRPSPSRKALDAIENDRRQLADYLASLGNAAPATVHDKLAEDYVKLRKLGVAGASDAAIEQYESILRDAPSYEDTDAVLYYLGLEYETVGNEQEAARRYQELMRRSPQSVYVPLAQFSLGELELDRAAHDSSAYRAALAAYLSAVEYSDAKIAAAARERIVEVYEALGDTANAARMRERISHER